MACRRVTAGTSLSSAVSSRKFRVWGAGSYLGRSFPMSSRKGALHEIYCARSVSYPARVEILTMPLLKKEAGPNRLAYQGPTLRNVVQPRLSPKTSIMSSKWRGGMRRGCAEQGDARE